MGDWGAAMDDMGGPVGPVTDEPQPIQEKKINKKKLTELEDKGAKLSIWVKDPDSRALKQLLKPLSLDVAAICSDVIFKERSAKEKDGGKLSTFHPKGNISEKAYKYVFEWIRRCGEEQAVADISDTSDIFNEKEGYKLLWEIRIVARELEIPEASFGKFLLKKSKNSAKEFVPDLDLVAEMFDPCEGDPELAELAAGAIFDNWYNFKLDYPDYDEYMSRLQIMREEKPSLDAAINAALEDKDNWLRGLREKKKREAEENEAAQASHGDDNNNTGGTNFGGDGPSGWETGGAAQNEPQDWETGGAAGTGNSGDWAGDTDAAAEDFGGNNGATSWADDVNEADTFTPTPVASVW